MDSAKHLPITLLPGLRQDTRDQFRKEGIESLQQIVAMQPADLRRFKGIKSTAESVHATARAFVNGHPIWYNPLPEVCHRGGWLFDIETDPRTMEVWCLGWSDCQDNAQVALVAPQVRRPTPFTLADGRTVIFVPDSDMVWEVFAEGVSGDDMPIYHWTGFDAAVMRKSAPEMVRETLDERLYDLHHVTTRAVRFPTSSTSIKAIAGYLQFAYSAYEAWDAAYNDYNLWLAREDVAALTRACCYQRDDVLAMGVVWRWLVTNAANSGL